MLNRFEDRVRVLLVGEHGEDVTGTRGGGGEDPLQPEEVRGFADS
jgi:hypothetical protein